MNHLSEVLGLIESVANSPVPEDVRVAVRSGLFGLDLALGGGFESGIVEVFGEGSSGKTALLGQIAGHAQKSGLPCAWVATEKIDKGYLSNLGVDLSRLPVISAAHAEEFLLDLSPAALFIDSLSALRPEDDSFERWNALMFDYLRRLRGCISPGSCVLASSQVRTGRSVSPGRTYKGGTVSNAKRVSDLFSVRLELERAEVSPPKYLQVVKIVANTLAPPSCFVEMEAKMGVGVDRELDLIESAVEVGAIEKSGAWFYLKDGTRLGHGKAAAAAALRDSENLLHRLTADTISAVS